MHASPAHTIQLEIFCWKVLFFYPQSKSKIASKILSYFSIIYNYRFILVMKCLTRFRTSTYSSWESKRQTIPFWHGNYYLHNPLWFAAREFALPKQNTTGRNSLLPPSVTKIYLLGNFPIGALTEQSYRLTSTHPTRVRKSDYPLLVSGFLSAQQILKYKRNSIKIYFSCHNTYTI